MKELRKEREAIAKNRKVDCFFLIIPSVITSISLFLWIFVGIFPAMALLCLPWMVIIIFSMLVKRQSGYVLMILFNIGYLIFICGMFSFPQGFKAETTWRYKFQHKYVERHNKLLTECMPEKLPDGVSDYRIDYLPHFLQGPGHFSIRFKTDTEQLDKYEAEYSGKALYTFSLSDYISNSFKIQEFNPNAIVSEQNDTTLELSYDRGFWEDHAEQATVYVVSATHNWNHPQSGAIIINKTDKMVEFTNFVG